jgi:hypothetical protein
MPNPTSHPLDGASLFDYRRQEWIEIWPSTDQTSDREIYLTPGGVCYQINPLNQMEYRNAIPTA